MRATPGATNYSAYFYVTEDVGGTNPGEPKTGMLFSDLTSASYMRQGGARVEITPITLASASATHDDGGFIEVDATNMKGLYRLDLPDAAIAAGVALVVAAILPDGAQNAVASPLEIDINAQQTGNSFANFDGSGRVDVGAWLGTAVTTSSTTNKPEVDVNSVSDDATAANNLESQYDGTGIVGDSFPSTQAQVGNLSSGAGGLSTVQEAGTFTLTTGTVTLGAASDTEAFDTSFHEIEDAASATEFYYEFDVGTSGVATEVLWEGFAQSNGDNYTISAFNWVSMAFEGVGVVFASNGTAPNSQAFTLPTSMTGTGADIGKVRWQVTSSDGTRFSTNRILCEFTSVAAEALIFAEGTAQGGGDNTIQIAAGQVGVNDEFQHASVILTGGTGAGQEAIVASSVEATDTLVVTPAWTGDNPDSTTVYQVRPGQAHASTFGGSYENGFVYVNTFIGTAGQLVDINGINDNQSDNLIDAYAIGVAKNIAKFFISAASIVTLPSNSDNLVFEGDSYTVLLNGQEASGLSLQKAVLIGTAISTAGDSLNLILCGLGDVTLPPTNGNSCGFFGTFTFGAAGSYTFGESSTVRDLPFVLDYAVAGNNDFFLTGWLGGDVELRNMSAGDAFTMNGNGGVTIAASCSDATVTLCGLVEVTGTGTNMTVDKTGELLEIKGDTFAPSTDALDAIREVIDVIDVATGTDIPATLAAQPTTTEFEARTLVSASYFDPAADPVANVTLVATTTINTDMRGTDGANTVAPDNTGIADNGTAIAALNDITAADVLAAGDVDGFSLEESQKLILAASVGVLAGAATTSITIEAADGSKTRITATVDADGNRSAVIKDVTG